ncbi:MAG: BREX system Lon protease-like protein BrxL [Bacteroides sp.]|nr:BREX system Lon protease-like protein BrxL [Bacteroides sp.]
MSYINQKIKDTFPDVSVMKSRENDSLFVGRNLPSFVKDFILRRFSDAEGRADKECICSYLNTKMSDNPADIKSRLISGERVNITTRFIIKTDLGSGRTMFSIPDAQLFADAYIDADLVEKHRKVLVDGEKWGNITLVYQEPQGRRRGYISMVEFKAFEPYRIDPEYFFHARENFTTGEWLDLLISTMEYNPEGFKTEEQKLELISRLLVFVEPRLNMIELGPKGTGKSYVYNNMSKYAWVVSGGKISRAKLFYNKSTKQYGLMKYYDVVAIDEISTFGFVEPDEMQSIMKNYLEAGKATVDNVLLQSECGIALMGNIALDSDRHPIDKAYYKTLPEMFRESATLDRFHAFIEGWKLPRLDVGVILQGWALNAEYFSSVLHSLRTAPEYEAIFEAVVEYDASCDLRDLKAVRKVATAYCKLVFPHVKSVASMDDRQLSAFKDDYRMYCLEPAVYRRSIIRNQCHLIDREFRPEMPEFRIK